MSGYIGSKTSVTVTSPETDSRYVNVTGDTMTGGLTVPSVSTSDDTNNYALVAGRFSAGYGGAVVNTSANASFLELQVNGFGGLRTDSAGRVTKPSQPIWGGRHSGGNLNDFVSMYNDAAVTNGSGWVLSGGGDERLYPPVSGWYQITMTGLANPSVATLGHTQAYLFKSGVSQYNASAGTTDYTRIIIHAYLYLTPTDWISFYTGGSAMHTDQAYNKVTCMLVA